MARKLTAEEVRRTQSNIRSIQTTRRTISFFVWTLLVVVLLVTFSVLAFLCGARASNAYILVNEGMNLRAECILQNGEVPDLAGYLTSECLKNDASLRSKHAATYSGYSVSSYDYRLTVDRMHVFPWHTELYVEVIEQIPSIKATPSEGVSPEIPEWTPVKYRLHLTKVEGRWLISEIEFVEVNPTIAPAHTPDPYMDPLPMATATPEPVVTASPEA